MSRHRESYEHGVHIVVVNVHPESQLKVGTRIEVRDLPVTIGRSLEAEVRLADSTVSREHARLEWCDGKHWVKALSSRSKVWVDKVQVDKGARVVFPGSGSFLQLGGVLLQVIASAPTEPFQRPLAPLTPQDALLYVECTDEAVVIRLGGKDVPLHRGPAFIVAALAARPNEAVHESEILLAGGGDPDRALERNLNQMITYARTAIASVLESDEALLKRLAAAVRLAAEARGDAWANEPDPSPRCPRQLARQLIKNQRNFGYSLRLLDDSLCFVDHRTPRI